MDKYREGKVKRTLVRGVKEILKPYAYKQSEPDAGMKPGRVMACLLENEPTSYGQ